MRIDDQIGLSLMAVGPETHESWLCGRFARANENEAMKAVAKGFAS